MISLNDLFRIQDVAQDSLVLPVVFVYVSALWGTVVGVLQAVRLIARRSSNNQAPVAEFGLAERFKTYVRSYGGCTIFGFMLARLVGTSGLLYISIVAPQQHCMHTSVYNFCVRPMVITFVSIHSVLIES